MMRPFFGKTKPSEFLQAMVDGLLEVEEAEDQKVAMSTFGSVSKSGICCGCAATWALQELAGRKLTKDEVIEVGSLFMETRRKRKHAIGEETPDRITSFEIAMDGARTGSLRGLSLFCSLPVKALEEWKDRWWLTDDNWKPRIPAVLGAIEEMKAAGF